MKVRLFAWLSSLVLSIIIFSSCVDLPDKFVIPSWDFELNIPLKSEVYYVEDILTLDSNVTIDSSENYRAYFLTGERYDREFRSEGFLKGQLDFDNDKITRISLTQGDSAISVDFKDGAEIFEADIIQGYIEIDINNNSNQLVDVEITIPGLVHYNGNNFQKDIEISPNEQGLKVIVPLRNHFYTIPDGYDPSKLLVNVSLSATPTEEEVVFQISISGSDFKYIKARILSSSSTDPGSDIDPINELIKLPMTDDAKEARDILSFQDATLTLSALLDPETYRDDAFDARLYNINIIGTRYGQGFVTLEDHSDGNEVLIEKGMKEKVYDNTNSNIADFMTFMPDEIRIMADLEMNPSNKIGIATNEDLVNLSFELESSSDVRILHSDGFADIIWFDHEFTTYKNLYDVDYTSGDTEMRDIIGDNGSSLKLFYEIDNGIPLNVDLIFTFRGLVQEVLFVDSVLVKGALASNASNGLSSTIISGYLEFDKERILKFVNCYSAEVKWIPHTPEIEKEEKIYFGPDQFFDFRTWLSLNLRLSEDLFGKDDDKDDENKDDKEGE